MPYFIDLERRQVVVMPPGAMAAPGQALVDANTATATGLQHGQPLTEAQVSALLSASPAAFRAATAQATGEPLPPDHTHSGTTSPPPPRSAAARAHGVARVVEGCAWVFLVIAVIGGIAVAAQTRVNEFGFEHHPTLGVGISIAIAGAFQALVVIMFAAYIQARTEP